MNHYYFCKRFGPGAPWLSKNRAKEQEADGFQRMRWRKGSRKVLFTWPEVVI
jgi:hypothetical protein